MNPTGTINGLSSLTTVTLESCQNQELPHMKTSLVLQLRHPSLPPAPVGSFSFSWQSFADWGHTELKGESFAEGVDERTQSAKDCQLKLKLPTETALSVPYLTYLHHCISLPLASRRRICSWAAEWGCRWRNGTSSYTSSSSSAPPSMIPGVNLVWIICASPISLLPPLVIPQVSLGPLERRYWGWMMTLSRK